MINVGGFSLRAFVVTLRWASLNGFPSDVSEWTQKESDTIQAVAEEYDRRQEEKNANN